MFQLLKISFSVKVTVVSGTGLHLKAQNASIAIAMLFECVI